MQISHKSKLDSDHQSSVVRLISYYQTKHARSYSSMTAEFQKSRIEMLLATMMSALTNSNKNAALAIIKTAYVLNRRGR